MSEITSSEKLLNIEKEISDLKQNLNKSVEIINQNFDKIFKHLAPKQVKIPGFSND